MTSNITADSFRLARRPFTDGGFCYGCYEGRHEKIINRKRRFTNSGNPILYHEQIYEGSEGTYQLRH